MVKLRRRPIRKFITSQEPVYHTAKAGLKKEELREALYSYTGETNDHLDDFYEKFHQQSEHILNMAKLELDVLKLALRKEIVDGILN